VLGNEYPRWMTVHRVPVTVRDDRTRRTDRLIHSYAADAMKERGPPPAPSTPPSGMIVRTTEAGEVLETVRIVNDVQRLASVMARGGDCPEVVLEAT
jgi:hypothetical protein